jgi:squalene-hopene/tetraprenyl-beta-curcumene cyclase
LIESTVEETALAVEALLARGEGQGVRGEEDAQSHPSRLTPHPSLARGLAWLCAAVDNGSLLDPAPIGFYFAKLWYYERLYPLIFTVSALGRAVRDRTASVEPYARRAN